MVKMLRTNNLTTRYQVPGTRNIRRIRFPFLRENVPTYRVTIFWRNILLQSSAPCSLHSRTRNYNTGTPLLVVWQLFSCLQGENEKKSSYPDRSEFSQPCYRLQTNLTTRQLPPAMQHAEEGWCPTSHTIQRLRSVPSSNHSQDLCSFQFQPRGELEYHQYPTTSAARPELRRVSSGRGTRPKTQRLQETLLMQTQTASKISIPVSW